MNTPTNKHITPAQPMALYFIEKPCYCQNIGTRCPKIRISVHFQYSLSDRTVPFRRKNHDE